jgi:uncharacterized membrane protein YdbT with pleckstrin-like domain
VLGKKQLLGNDDEVWWSVKSRAGRSRGLLTATSAVVAFASAFVGLLATSYSSLTWIAVVLVVLAVLLMVAEWVLPGVSQRGSHDR